MLSLLAESGVTTLDGVVLDLGVSSFQLDQAAREVSASAPMVRSTCAWGAKGRRAAELVNTLPERELADMLFEFGEERLSRRIARAIVAARAEAPIVTHRAARRDHPAVVPADRSGIDPATRSFQALRIRVNDELGEIERALVAGGAAARARRAARGGRRSIRSRTGS